MKRTRRCGNSQHGFSDSSSSINTRNTRRTIRNSAGPAAEKSNSPLTFNRNQDSKGGTNDSTEASRVSGIGAIHNRDDCRIHHPSNEETVEEENSGRSRA